MAARHRAGAAFATYRLDQLAMEAKKGSGLVKACAAALRKVIDNGRYGKVLARWGLTGEHLKTSQINPPGLPRTAN
ncbi:hypothetical protein SLV14_006184 [Streptomyces sp. Je 1-4]|uniref:hypothetical protein n=1 Tax=unclassified Streptomyces TaxID=2593676 RepID=UPI0021D7F74A|nr:MULTISPECIES: hypothetical protein [unclassified Streptomyces]UYB43231.1 hypothetical protein SLV14_006184 [Streptomyces sp. Je 1-4]UZQ39598.1 hypothetical protein SLV14N_006184 [Streptomyces sp. Je 1-4] [Streptomyces sp. Je 1-4 4N24]UZQ47015.1 hypothetical protein SLV14NA_006184 [Streptomyces sp. Je 1-4] [Streptomyces sp. Je 1-4 4N24_ara]